MFVAVFLFSCVYRIMSPGVVMAVLVAVRSVPGVGNGSPLGPPPTPTPPVSTSWLGPAACLGLLFLGVGHLLVQ